MGPFLHKLSASLPLRRYLVCKGIRGLITGCLPISRFGILATFCLCASGTAMLYMLSQHSSKSASDDSTQIQKSGGESDMKGYIVMCSLFSNLSVVVTEQPYFSLNQSERQPNAIMMQVKFFYCLFHTSYSSMAPTSVTDSLAVE